MVTSSRQAPSAADNRILFALYRLKYLTPAMLCRVLYSYPGAIRYAESNLKRLADAGYLSREWIPSKGRGNSPSYYRLSTKGISHLARVTPEVTRKRVRSIESTFIRHTLDISMFLVQTYGFCKAVPDFQITTALHELELRELNMDVLVGGRRRTVTPDGWVDLWSEERQRRLCVALELQRTVIEQKRWLPKIEGLIAWTQTSMRPALKTRDVVIAFVTSAADREVLVHKTERALERLSKPEWGEIFCFWGGALTDVSPVELFTRPVWYQPFHTEPVELLEGVVEE